MNSSKDSSYEVKHRMSTCCSANKRMAQNIVAKGDSDVVYWLRHFWAAQEVHDADITCRQLLGMLDVLV